MIAHVSPAVGPFTIAAALLVLGGVAKALRPGDTATALRGIGLPGSRVIVRVGGAAEVALGAVAIIVGGLVPAVLVGLSYLAFAAFVVVALVRRAPIATCGCFGRADTPPSLVHVGVNVAAVAAAVAFAVHPDGALVEVLRDQPLAGVPYLLLVATGVFAAFVALTALPTVLDLARIGRTGAGATR